MSHDSERRTVRTTPVESLIPHDRRRQLYEYICEHGPVTHSELDDELFPNDPRAVQLHLSQLERIGVVELDGNRARASFAPADFGPVTEAKLPDASEPLVIRPANSSDRAELSDVVRRVVAADQYVAAKPLRRTLAAETETTRGDGLDGVLYAVSLGETVCGWAHCRCDTRPNQTHMGVLTGGIDPADREQGIGSVVLSYVVDWAAQRELTRLYQAVPATDENAITFLTERGWAVESWQADRYRIDGDCVDKVVLTRVCD